MSDTRAPSRKVTSVGLAGALTTIAVWVIAASTSIDVPPEVAAAITTVLSVLTGYIVSDD